MSDTLDQLVEGFFANLRTADLAAEQAEKLAAAGQPNAARMFRAIAACERVRIERFRCGMAHHARQAVDYFVCPHCGLIYIPEPPETCCVDNTPAADFIKIE